MDGIVDVYMPDFKFWDPEMARHYTKARNYPNAARRAIKAMHEQVGDLVFDEDGLALRGVLIRHLVMPNDIAGTREIMRWIVRELGANTYVNVMPQYVPAGKVSRTEYAEIGQRITDDEFRDALVAAREAGLWRLDARSVAAL
jgi:putative pyruvate formate lyase activating enzyme